MLEQDALKRWCPFARQAAMSADGINRYATGEILPGSYCIGSACMAWDAEWAPGETINLKPENANDRMQNEPGAWEAAPENPKDWGVCLRRVLAAGDCGLKNRGGQS